MYVVVSHKYSYGMQIFTLHSYATSSVCNLHMLRRKLLLCHDMTRETGAAHSSRPESTVQLHLQISSRIIMPLLYR
jgi:hypothetical protein